ncbi:MAG: CoA-binding protein [Thermoplasmata archaeon]
MASSPADEIGEILERYKTVAVVGLSTNPAKDAHQVPRFVQERGYRVVPVNPHAQTILGEKAYRRLRDIPFPIDIVEIFRPPEEVPGIVEEALATEAQVIWMQSGIRHEAAAEKARRAGLKVVQDRCMRTELLLRGGPGSD